MASKFFGKIGIGQTVQVDLGVWDTEIREHPVYGELLKNSTTKYIETTNLNDDIRITNEISIVADSYIVENSNAIKYIMLSPTGTKWKVTSVTLGYPRMTLTTGGEYNG